MNKKDGYNKPSVNALGKISALTQATSEGLDADQDIPADTSIKGRTYDASDLT